MKIESKKINSGESGNALFLILIAVALFAALSYAITQSGRGGGNVGQQTALITAGQVTEEPADVRSAATRMILTGVTGASITYLGDPACGSVTLCASDVFDQSNGGGGATNVPPPTAACATLADCDNWVYVPAFAGIENAGTGHGYFVLGVGSAGLNGSDAMALLKGTGGMNQLVCQAIQKGLGFAVATPPVLAQTVLMTYADGTGSNAGYVAAGNGQTIVDTGATLSNQDFACVSDGGVYAYYGSLIDQ